MMWRRALALLALASTMLALLAGLPLQAGTAAADGQAVYSAGYVTIQYTDSYAQTIDAVVYYPATSEGEDAPPESSNAPYPSVVLVHARGLGAVSARAYGPYGLNLSRHGYVVAVVNMTPNEAQAESDSRIANSTLDAIDALGAQNATAGSRLEGIVDTSRVVLVGHGVGARVALLAALGDSTSRVQGVVSLGLVDGATGGAPPAAPLTGRLGLPMHVQGGNNDSVASPADWTTAFERKARGHVSLHILEGGNHTQYIQGPWPDGVLVTDRAASISPARQRELAFRYVLAFLDFHLMGDAQASSRLYGAEATADLLDGTLAHWRYGVVDEAVKFIRPVQSGMVPAGPNEFCATVENVGVFPMVGRNVTLEVARVEGMALVVVLDKTNRTAPAMMPGGRTVLSWTTHLGQYGDYRAFLTMDDPDHNLTNNRAVIAFTVSALPPAIIVHTPPGSAELGEAVDLVVRIESVSGVGEAWANYTDPDGGVGRKTLVQNTTSGLWHATLPAAESVGVLSYTVHVVAGNGAPNATALLYVPVLDTTPPRIVEESPGEFLRVRQAVEMRASVTDLGGVSLVKLAFTDPTTGFHNSSCGRKGDVWFNPIVLGPDEGNLTYLWWAQDVWGNVVVRGPFELEVRDMGPPVIVPVPAEPVELGAEFGLAANVTDDSLIASVWVVYTAPGATGPVNATPVLRGPLYRLSVGALATPGTFTYEWGAMDVNGRVGRSGPLELEVVDSDPPVIADIEFGDAVAGHGPWVQAKVTDDGAVAQVLLHYTDVLGSDSSLRMSDQGGGVFRGVLPVQSRGGEVKFRVLALDLAGNQASSGERTLVVRDMTAPVLFHAPPPVPVQGADLRLRVNVTDDVGVARVVVEIKLTPMGVFQRIDMQLVGSGVWEHVVPGAQVNPPEIVYYFEATDLLPSSNLARDPSDAPASLYRVGVTQRLLAVHGTVRDVDGEPVEGARIAVVGTDLEVQSAANGSYRIEGVTAGTHTLWVWAPGFQDVRLDVLLSVEVGDRRQDFNLVVEREGPPGEDYNVLYAAIGVLLIALAVFILAIRLRMVQRKGRGRG